MKKLDDFKELLTVLPRNNIKNSKTYYHKALMMKEETQRFKDRLLKEIENRYNSLIIPIDNEDLNKIKNQIMDTKKNLYLLSNYNDSYEKSGLDLLLYKVRKFYNDDLTKVNENIKEVVGVFNQVGINLTPNDFIYGEVVGEYMNVFFTNYEDDKLLRDSFDKLYWKEPDIIEHIYLNFRYLYSINKKKFDKYYENRLVEYNMTNKAKYLNDYKNDLWNYLILKESNIKLIQDKFINGVLDIKDYDDVKTDKIEEGLIAGEMTDNLKMESLCKLSYTLYEYKNYLKYKYIIDEIKNIYGSKDANKNLTKDIVKNIGKHEGKIVKLNKKINFKKKMSRNPKIDKFKILLDTEIDELKQLYVDYDDAKFKEKIANSLNDESSLLDALNLALSFKINLFNILKLENEEKTEEEMLKEIDALEEFSYYPNITILNNISIKEDRDISMIILDKYKLMNISITYEEIGDTNLDSLISNVNKVVVKNYMKKNNINYVDFKNACDMKVILDKESKK